MSRTLPFSLSGALLGIALAAADYRVDWKTALFLVLAVVFLHFYLNSIVDNISDKEGYGNDQ